MKKIGKKILFVLIIVITISIIIIFKNLNKIEQQQAKIVATNENEIENVVVEDVTTENDVKIDRSVTKKAVVVKVEEKSLKVIDYQTESLYIVSVRNEDMSKFKQGQEIKIYYDGIVLTSYPGQITADKVEIIKEKSDKEIPLEVLRFYNYSQDNISVAISELSKEGIDFYIIDSNEYPLDYGECCEYEILKKNVENEEYNQNLGIDYNAITPGKTTDTYTTTSSYNPDPNRFKTVWEEPKVLNEYNKLCNWSINSDNILTLRGKINWNEIYGKLGEGEYEIKLCRTPEIIDSFFKCVRVKFFVDENGNVTYEYPSLGF